MSKQEPDPLQVFVSFASSDGQLKEAFMRHLSILCKVGTVRSWSVEQLRPGSDWRKEAEAALARADVALLLLSKDFLASQMTRGGNLQRLLERRAKLGLRVIPVLLRTCAWRLHSWFSALVPLPKSGKAIAAHAYDARDQVMTQVVEQIAALAAEKAVEAESKKFEQTAGIMGGKREFRSYFFDAYRVFLGGLGTAYHMDQRISPYDYIGPQPDSSRSSHAPPSCTKKKGEKKSQGKQHPQTSPNDTGAESPSTSPALRRVFVSYLHESDAHGSAVLGLAYRLRSDGADVALRQRPNLPEDGGDLWLQHELEKADFILLVCTRTYKEAFDGSAAIGRSADGRGAEWEAKHIHDWLRGQPLPRRKVVPVALTRADLRFIPDLIRSQDAYALDEDYEDLLSYLELSRGVEAAPPTAVQVTAPAPVREGVDLRQRVTQWYEGLGFRVTTPLEGDGFDLFVEREVETTDPIRIGIRCWTTLGSLAPESIIAELMSALERSRGAIYRAVLVTPLPAPARVRRAAEETGLIRVVTLRALHDRFTALPAAYRQYVRLYETDDVFQTYVPLNFEDDKPKDHTEARAAVQPGDYAEEIADGNGLPRVGLRAVERKRATARPVEIGRFVIEDNQSSHGAPPPLELKNAEDLVMEWIYDGPPGLLSVLADFGAGKTTLLRRIKYNLVRDYLRGFSTVKPVFLPLREFHRAGNLEGFLLQLLPREFQQDIPLSLFWDEVEKGGLVLLLDGFDEMSSHHDAGLRAENMVKLGQLTSRNCKVLLTCRPTYFVTSEEYNRLVGAARLVATPAPTNVLTGGLGTGRKQRSREKPLERRKADREAIARHLRGKFQESPSPLEIEPGCSRVIHLQGFDERQIDRFLSHYDDVFREKTGHGASWLKEHYLLKVYDLKDLMRRPILLRMIAETLATGHLDVEHPSASLGPAELYETYTLEQFARDFSDKGATRQLLTIDQRCSFAEALALSMFARTVLEVSFDDIVEIVRQNAAVLPSLRELFARVGESQIAADLQITTFLQRNDQGMFRFAHKSFMEFFVARYLKERIRNGQRAAELTRPLPREILYFLGGFASAGPEIYDRLVGWMKGNLPQEHQDVFLKNVASALLAAGTDAKDLSLSNCAVGVDLIRARQVRLRLRGVKLEQVRVEDIESTECTFEDLTLAGVEAKGWMVERSLLTGTVERVRPDGGSGGTHWSKCHWTGSSTESRGLCLSGGPMRFEQCQFVRALVSLSATRIGESAIVGSQFEGSVLSARKLSLKDCNISGGTVRLEEGTIDGNSFTDVGIFLSDTAIADAKVKGGSVVCASSSTTLKRCHFEGVRAELAGVFVDCKFIGCTFRSGASAQTFTRCQFERCSGELGGAVTLEGTSISSSDDMRFTGSVSVVSGELERLRFACDTLEIHKGAGLKDCHITCRELILASVRVSGGALRFVHGLDAKGEAIRGLRGQGKLSNCRLTAPPGQAALQLLGKPGELVLDRCSLTSDVEVLLKGVSASQCTMGVARAQRFSVEQSRAAGTTWTGLLDASGSTFDDCHFRGDVAVLKKSSVIRGQCAYEVLCLGPEADVDGAELLCLDVFVMPEAKLSAVRFRKGVVWWWAGASSLKQARFDEDVECMGVSLESRRSDHRESVRCLYGMLTRDTSGWRQPALRRCARKDGTWGYVLSFGQERRLGFEMLEKVRPEVVVSGLARWISLHDELCSKPPKFGGKAPGDVIVADFLSSTFLDGAVPARFSHVSPVRDSTEGPKENPEERPAAAARKIAGRSRKVHRRE